MIKQTKVLWITRTAILLALLVVLQAATVPLGNNFITGSIVNAMLVISVMTCGLATGVTIAAISPVLPTLLGFGPVWPLVPFIAAGNVVLVLIWHLIGNIKTRNKYLAYGAALPVAAGAKFTVLYFGVVKVAVEMILKLPEKQASVITFLFSYPQLITALIGGAVATIVFPTLKKVIAKDRAGNSE